MQAYKVTMTNADLMEIYKFLEVKNNIFFLFPYIHTYIHIVIYIHKFITNIYSEIYEVDFKVSGIEPGPLVPARVHE